MRKVLVAIALALLPAFAGAQTTWNVRGGVSLNISEMEPAIELIGEFNTPFQKGERWTFSQSVHAFLPCPELSGITANSYVGYRCPIKKRVLFYPKVGFGFGYLTGWNCGGFVVGPSVELAFEIKHFIVAANFMYSPLGIHGYYDDDVYNTSMPISMTFGYKF